MTVPVTIHAILDLLKLLDTVTLTLHIVQDLVELLDNYFLCIESWPHPILKPAVTVTVITLFIFLIFKMYISSSLGFPYHSQITQFETVLIILPYCYFHF